METQINITPSSKPQEVDKWILIKDTLGNSRLYSSEGIDSEDTTVDGFNMKELLDELADLHDQRDAIQIGVTFSFMGWNREDPELKELETLISAIAYSRGGKLDIMQKRISDGEDPFGVKDQIDKIINLYITETFGQPQKDVPEPHWIKFMFGQVEEDQEVI